MDADKLILSQNRAKSFVDYLCNKGNSKKHLTSKGYGEKQPMDSNETAEGRVANRRTEFQIVEM